MQKLLAMSLVLLICGGLVFIGTNKSSTQPQQISDIQEPTPAPYETAITPQNTLNCPAP